MSSLSDKKLLRDLAGLESHSADVMGIASGGLPYDYGAFSDSAFVKKLLAGNAAALEDLSLEDEGADMHHLPPPADADAKCAPTQALVTMRDGIVRVSLPGFYCDDLESRNSNIVALCIYLRQLSPNAKVEISARAGRSLIGVGGGTDFMVYYIPLLSAIQACKAHKVFILDHMLSSYEPYLAFACNEVQVREMGAMVLNPDRASAESEGKCAQVKKPYFDKLVDWGVEHRLLTSDEAESVKLGRMVHVSNTALLARVAAKKEAPVQ